MPPDPPRAFLFQLQICFAEKKNTLEIKVEIITLSKFLATPLVNSDCITACPFSIKKCAKMSVFFNVKTVKIRWGETPIPPVMNPPLPNLRCDTHITYNFCVLLLC